MQSAPPEQPTPPPAMTFKGNKQHLPQKPCAHCQRPMTWRKKWALTWEQVKYCSERCRREAGPAQAGAQRGIGALK